MRPPVQLVEHLAGRGGRLVRPEKILPFVEEQVVAREQTWLRL
ncbi:hypothetical protein [Saccharopolyspora aridisoli]|nr:hypothetical protein [Saccharopolyspora aridisoli]